MQQTLKRTLVACIFSMSAALAACGGSSSGGNDAGNVAQPPPTTTTYSIGGVVDGLEAPGLVLRNNGSDDLTITANGRFDFSTSLPTGSAYEVTILNQPGSDARSQSCMVTLGAGTISGSNINNVVVSCVTTAINGIPVPADPGAAGLATLAGVDTDQNGIRDDVDIFIATRYGLNQEALRAARISARAHQLSLETDPSDVINSRIVRQDSGDAGVCAGRGFRAAGLVAITELNEIYLHTYNTVERLNHHRSIGATAGLFERSINVAECP